MQNKNNPILVETILTAKKNKNWVEVASLISAPRKKRAELNLDQIKINSTPRL